MSKEKKNRVSENALYLARRAHADEMRSREKEVSVPITLVVEKPETIRVQATHYVERPRTIKATVRVVDGLTIPLTGRALKRRINRKLGYQGEQLRTCPESSRWHNVLGDYYIVNVVYGWTVAQHVDLEDLGRELGVLRPSEVLEAAQ